jgi:hypothetical protein
VIAGGCALLDLIVGWLAVVLALLPGLCATDCDQSRTLPWGGALSATIGLVAGTAVLFGPSAAPANRFRNIGLLSCVATALAVLLITSDALITV